MKAIWLAAALLSATARAADTSCLCSVALKEAYLELLPQFEKESGHKVTATWTGTSDMMKRLKAGEVFDMVLIASDSLEELTDTGKVMAGSRVDIARSGVGVAVKSGAQKPDISSPEALKRALLAAKSIGISSGPSGVYLSDLFARMGVLEELKPKFKVPPSGAPVGELVAKGEAEIGFQQISELVHVPGIDYIGPLPPEIQRMTTFSAGIHPDAKEPEAAQAWMKFLSSAEAAPVLRRHGLEPAGGNRQWSDQTIAGRALRSHSAGTNFQM
jgi:molybdate transport system substrate-binding protein